MCNIVDPLGGSYHVESLTKELVDRAWEIIDKVETKGGMAKAVAAGWPKSMIEEVSAARAVRVDRLEILDVDNHAVREAQIRRIEKVKAGPDETACKAALRALCEGADGKETLFGRYSTTPIPVKGIYGGADGEDACWLSPKNGVVAVGRQKGRRPRMRCGDMSFEVLGIQRYSAQAQIS